MEMEELLVYFSLYVFRFNIQKMCFKGNEQVEALHFFNGLNILGLSLPFALVWAIHP